VWVRTSSPGVLLGGLEPRPTPECSYAENMLNGTEHRCRLALPTARYQAQHQDMKQMNGVNHPSVPWQVGRRIVFGVMATLIATIAAACGGANSPTSSSTATPGSTLASAPPRSPSVTPTPAVVSASPCSSQQLSVRLDKFNAPDVNGDRSGFLAVENSSAFTCTIAGYPMVALHDAANRAIPVTLERGGFGAPTIHDPGTQTIDLAPNAAAYFGMSWFNTGRSCRTSVRSEVTLPGDVAPRPLPMTLVECPVGLNPGPLAVTAIGTAAAFAGGNYLP
jgi:hypothetical protein